MPVDPVILHKYAPPSAPVRRPRERLRGLAVLGAGVALGAAGLGAGWNSAAAATAVVGAVAVLTILAVVALMVVGWREDGVLGVYYRLRHPLGTAMGADDRPGWPVLAAVLVVALLWAVAMVLGVRHPAAAPWTMFKPPVQSKGP